MWPISPHVNKSATLFLAPGCYICDFCIKVITLRRNPKSLEQSRMFFSGEFVMKSLSNSMMETIHGGKVDTKQLVGCLASAVGLECAFIGLGAATAGIGAAVFAIGLWGASLAGVVISCG